MAELKTKATDASVTEFLNRISNEQKRDDCYMLLGIMVQAAHAPPVMWGRSIVGFGSAHFVYESGRELDWFLVGFSPRKQKLTLYAMSESWEQYGALLKKLGKHSLGKGCLYLETLDDVHIPTLAKLIRRAVKDARGLAGKK